ncbi:hypothetical protein [Chitinophaga sancti]|uniref:Uncharacterized protein n=1 Tax=Chitinophaga sancti TaxID=1004 RepID=A0A1K1T121_9BACT|nr:hypothetical protein [Chitinophaga sancti]WQD59597.1 hypothetical protein U0033_17050 [Chitinophaga sancti]WQG88270.1 hypothetical protein SR876_25415 [Chitinophaga sancti]SFW90196.1 hypothetical protein SAMN05661012_06570 [Chitinophaga sancti]
MKNKTSIILSVIGLFSLLGGSLAFKAQHKFNGALFCYTNVGSINANFEIVYAPILSARYSTAAPMGTLFCTLPAALHWSGQPIWDLKKLMAVLAFTMH